MRHGIAFAMVIGCAREQATIAPVAEKVDAPAVTASVATTLSAFVPYADRRVAVIGTVEPLIKSASALWVSIPIRLPDGGRVTVNRGKVFDWEPLVGKTATVIGRVRLSGTGAAMLVDLDDPGTPCAGTVPRCGLE
ncbi:MAG: hypothetical protein ACXVEF_20915 [Polyangiales bacterium]